MVESLLFGLLGQDLVFFSLVLVFISNKCFYVLFFQMFLRYKDFKTTNEIFSFRMVCKHLIRFLKMLCISISM